MTTTGYKIHDQYATHFITLTVVGWIDLFSRKECKQIIIESLKHCQKEKGLDINAYVIMPSHLHLIVTAKETSKGLSNILRDFKTFTSKSLLKWTLSNNKESRKDWLEVVFTYHAKYNTNNTKYQLWIQNNKPMQCIQPKFTNQKINYIHQNPVTADIVSKAEHYNYSSAKDYLGMKNSFLDIALIDFGVQEGYVTT